MGRVKIARKNRTAYKKVIAKFDRDVGGTKKQREVLVKLIIPKGAKIQLGNVTDRVRVSKVIPKKFIYIDGAFFDQANLKGASITGYHSRHTSSIQYQLGAERCPELPFDEDPDKLYTSGIHCFLRKKLALEYSWN